MKIEFPKDFLWGTATSSCQIEGSQNIDGKVDTVWDKLSRDGKILRNENPFIACDHYHKYKEDVALLKELGVNHYRFSVCWARIITDINGTVNQKGIEFYSNLVDELLANGITPYVTLFHWDYPQYLADAFGGMVSREIVPHFKLYCDTIIKALGDRVVNWMTINEPIASSYFAYYKDAFIAPAIKSDNKSAANSIHNILMCHGVAVKSVRENARPDAKVGIVFNPVVRYPIEEQKQIFELIENLWEMDNGYFMDPIYYGKYPTRTFRGLPDCTPDIMPGDMELINQKTDFLGLNVYFGYVVEPDAACFESCSVYIKPSDRILDTIPQTPDAFYYTIKYLYDHYPINDLIITESGSAWRGEDQDYQVNDDYRIDYMKMHLKSIKKAMDEGYKVSGFTYWSLMDNFEWNCGYEWKYGLIYIDKDLNRIPKKSFYWYKELIEKGWFEE
ncbi:MAG: family 1 glycosylhydrolase [Abditibacteriota bacterium]|nr:family 1 glycosylhydrolase [Abditibacteriota bacterium]